MTSNTLFTYLSQRAPGYLEFGNARMALLDIEAGFWEIRRQVDALIGTGLTGSVFEQAGAHGGRSFAKTFEFSPNHAEQLQIFESCLQAYMLAGFGDFSIEQADWPNGRMLIRAQNAFEAWMTSVRNQTSEEPVCAYSAGVLVGFVNTASNKQDVVCIEHHCQAQGHDHCLFELLPVSQAGGQDVVAMSPDPKMGQQINLLEMLFDRMPMGVAVIGRDFRLIRCNPTWSAFIGNYTPTQSIQVIPGAHIFDLEPGTEEIITPLFNSVFKGETIRQSGVRIESGGIESYWDIVLTPLYEGSQIVGLLNVSIDATERETVLHNLENRVAERTRELTTLLDISAVANSSLELTEMLQTTLTRLNTLVNASRSGVMLIDEAKPENSVSLLVCPPNALSPDEKAMMLQACQRVADTSEAWFNNAEPEKGLQEPAALLPLQVRGQALGVLVIYGQSGESFTTDQKSLFRSIAEQLSMAIENARLYEQAEQVAVTHERNRLARDLHDAVTQTLFSASLIAEALPTLWNRSPEMGSKKLAELRLLTRGALSEMRTLLFELRPDTFSDADLGDLYQHLGNAFTGRTQVPVKLTMALQAPLSPEVKETFYRVAQEALNNISKHAEATAVEIQLDVDAEKASVSIKDDGCGFNEGKLPAESMGLGIMRERADAIGAALEIVSSPGEGTRITMLLLTAEEDNV